MSRTVPCPHSASSHKEHYENSPQFRECEAREKRRVQRERRIALERFRAGNVAEVPSAYVTAPTVMQKLAASANRPSPKNASDGLSFGG